MHRVFTRTAYLALATGIAILVFLSIVWLPDIQLIAVFLFDPSIPLLVAIRLTTDLLASSLENASIFFISYTTLTALLIGINSALLIFYVRLYQIIPSFREVTVGAVGSFLALIGFGCVSCGSIFLTALVVAASGTGLAATASYLGVGIGILGIGLLILSAIFLSRAINTPPVCAL